MEPAALALQNRLAYHRPMHFWRATILLTLTLLGVYLVGWLGWQVVQRWPIVLPLGVVALIAWGLVMGFIWEERE